MCSDASCLYMSDRYDDGRFTCSFVFLKPRIVVITKHAVTGVPIVISFSQQLRFLSGSETVGSPGLWVSCRSLMGYTV